MQITQRQIKRLEARDRRLAAVHEAGHIVVARKLGIPQIDARLTKCANSDPMERTSWSGQHRACLRGVSKQKRTMYAVAGTVAEACWNGLTALDIDWDDRNIMSPTDWAETGREPGNPDRALYKAVDAVFELLNRDNGCLWPRLVREARWLDISPGNPPQ